MKSFIFFCGCDVFEMIWNWILDKFHKLFCTIFIIFDKGCFELKGWSFANFRIPGIQKLPIQYKRNHFKPRIHLWIFLGALISEEKILFQGVKTSEIRFVASYNS